VSGLHLVGILFPYNIDDARSKPHQIFKCFDTVDARYKQEDVQLLVYFI
jgi:hypothetical protein